jgi:hypothetical protein
VGNKEKPIRYRKVREDAEIGPFLTKIEKQLGLPGGSVKVVGPNGRKIRSDASVAAIRKKWD